MVFTAGLAMSQKALKRSAYLARRRLLVTLDIPSHDHSYPWFLEWMARNSAADVARSEALAASGRGGSIFQRIQAMKELKSHELSVETLYKKHDNGSSEAYFSLIPGPGTHYFNYKGAWIQLKRTRSGSQLSLTTGVPWETLTLTTLSRDRDLFSQLLSEARTLAQKHEEGKTVVYTRHGFEWRPFGKARKKREIGSVVLDKGVGEEVEADLKRFMGREKWYADRGIPYRRGYLLHGPPGSGKSSYIQALAGLLSYDICFLNLAERGLTDDSLQQILSLVPDRSFVLIEDIDAAFSKRVQTSADGYQSGVTFSGLLNTLDGIASSSSRIVFMTTNHLSSLDPALIRPGRVDLVSYIGDATPHQARELFVRFYLAANDSSSVALDSSSEGSEKEEAVKEMAERVGEMVRREKDERGRAISMAALQGLFIRCEEGEVEGELEGLFEERGTGLDLAGGGLAGQKE
ncbi:BCS1 N terminal-domain-containing protein [Mrakia frigida]|uniref:mitochondrial chaperone BCS1 n=1 Tax=Mrakia frigida TaxID=29902 RepID=UPI003FCBF623